MSRLLNNASLLVAVCAALLGGAGAASADSGAEAIAAHSPGLLSGNVVQVPTHVPVNACGNTVSVIGVLNPAFGNTCVNSSHHASAWN